MDLQKPPFIRGTCPRDSFENPLSTLPATEIPLVLHWPFPANGDGVRGAAG